MAISLNKVPLATAEKIVRISKILFMGKEGSIDEEAIQRIFNSEHDMLMAMDQGKTA